MFIQFFIDLYNKICDWFDNLFVLKDKEKSLADNAEYFNYDDVYHSSNNY
jgi:hypothetical protein